LSTPLARIVKEAFEVQSGKFIESVEHVTSILEKEDGNLGNLHLKGKLVEVKPVGNALVVGDLHGDLESLIEILERSNILARMDKSSDSILIFLGDYGDRGGYSAETYYTVLKLKALHPEQVVLMRGNHEGPGDLMPSPHDLPMQFQARFGEKWAEAYAKTRGLFEHLYNALLVDKRYLMVHGGLPRDLNTIEDLAYLQASHHKRSTLEEILWNDPDEAVVETSASPRGAGRLFGRNATDRILAKLDVKILIRGHEPCEDGFRINHGGKVLTLFSRKGPPYFNAHGAYLDLPLAARFENAKQLLPYIHKF